MAFSALLEALQGLTPDRTPDLPTALCARPACRRRCSPAGFGQARERDGRKQGLALARSSKSDVSLRHGEFRAQALNSGQILAASSSADAAPIVVQSMTNTDTADIEATVAQVAALARAGSELVRITVDRDEAAAAVPHIRERLDARGRRRAADRRLPL